MPSSRSSSVHSDPHRINVKILQYDGSVGVSLILAPRENEVLADGEIQTQPDDSMMMVKARIMDFVHEKLPGYNGGFHYVLLLSDVLSLISTLDKEENNTRKENLCEKACRFEDLSVDEECDEDVIEDDPDYEIDEEELLDEEEDCLEDVEDGEEDFDDEVVDDYQELGEWQEEDEISVCQDVNVVDQHNNGNVETLHIRLTSLYLGPESANVPFTANSKKRSHPSSGPLPFPHIKYFDPEGFQPAGDDAIWSLPINPGPVKRCKKEDWQTDKSEVDPVNVLTDMINNHLKGFVRAPELTKVANEVAMGAYFDWLDNVKYCRHPGHFVITGNPGVGKTTGAWALAKFLAESGIVQNDMVVEAHRDDLVDRYVGGTELKTNMLIRSAGGGVVIFDEIYTLNKPSSSNDTGKEALTTIMKYMTNVSAPVFMFLGYKAQMNDFVNMNPGFQRRIKYIVDMADYNAVALAEIMKLKLEELGLQLERDANDLEKYFEDLNPSYLQLRNASVAVAFISHAHANARKRAMTLPPNQRRGVARVLQKEDLIAAYRIIKKESSGCATQTDPVFGIFI